MSPAERISTRALINEIGRDRTLVIVEHDMDAIFELAEQITVLTRAGCWRKALRTQSSVTRRCRTPISEACARSMSLLEARESTGFYGEKAISCSTSRCAWRRTRWWRCWAATAPARRRRCARSWACWCPGSGQYPTGRQADHGRPPYEIARMGLQLVPEERAIFGCSDSGGEFTPGRADGAERVALWIGSSAAFPRLPERRRSGGSHAVGWRAADAGDREGVDKGRRG